MLSQQLTTNQQTTEPASSSSSLSELAPSPAWSGRQPRGNAAAVEEMSSSGQVEVQSGGSGAVMLLSRLAGLSKPFATLIASDGAAEVLSGEDLAREQQSLCDALPDLKAHADTPAQASEAIWLIYEITTLPTDESKQRAIDLRSGAVVEIPLPEKLSRSAIGGMLSATRRNLTAAETIQDNKSADGTDPVSRTKKDDFADTIGDAMAARSTLQNAFRFDTSDRSFEAVERLAGELPDDKIGSFVDAYLTAFFVHGGNLSYDHDEIKARPTSAFFGSPPGCDQLPDGRGIIDCQGFGAVGRLILKALKGATNERGGDDLCLPFAINNHQVVLLLAGTAGSVVDNDRVHDLALSTSEREHIHALHEGRFSDSFLWGETKEEVTGPVDLDALPSLRAVVDQISARFGWAEVRVSWLEALDVD